MTIESSSAESLGLLFQELMAQVHRRFAGDAMRTMNECGLTMPQIVTLHLLRFSGGMSINGLAEQLRLSTSASSHLVDRLFEKGFVDRREATEDRRHKRVQITDTGIEIIDRLTSERTAEFARALSTIDEELRQQLIVVVRRTIEQLDRDEVLLNSNEKN